MRESGHREPDDMTSAVKSTRNETAWAPHDQPPRIAGPGHGHVNGNLNGFNMSKIPQLLNPNPRKINNGRRQFVNGGSGHDDVGPSFSHYVSFDITGCNRSEIRSLKDRLNLELDRIRHLSSQIELGEYPDSKKRSVPQPQQNPKRFASDSPPYRASESIMKQCSNVLAKLMKQKVAYVFNTPVDAVALGLHDYHLIIKNPMDLGTIKRKLSKNGYPTPEEFAADVRLTFDNALRYNPEGHEVHTMARDFLTRFEQWFWPIFDKYQLEKRQFQQREKDRHHKVVENNWVRDRADSSWIKQGSPEVPNKPLVAKQVEPVEPPRIPTPPPPALVPAPISALAPTPLSVVAPTAQVPAPVSAVAQTPLSVVSPTPTPNVVPGPTPNPTVSEVVQVKGNLGRVPSGKLPKPKAKDPNKRPMSVEEKYKLGTGLQSLPEEKMAHVIHIIRKRNEDLTQDGDEIELDIEAVDTETLWELDRFVTNYKKMASKIKRQALMGVSNNNVGHHSTPNEVGSTSERVTETSKVKKSGGDAGEEDVDIGDEILVNNFPPLEIDKDDDRQQGGHGGGGASNSSSSSSSSSSDSSSSSADSDSGSSSGSDSDVDDAQSRDNESKNIHHS